MHNHLLCLSVLSLLFASAAPLPTVYAQGCATSAATLSAPVMPSALNPTNSLDLRLVGSLGGNTRAVAASGNSAAVLFSRSDTLVTYIPATATTSAIRLPDTIEDIALDGTTSYVAAGAGGLHLFSAIGTSSVRLPGLAAAVALDGQRAYVAAAGTAGGLHVVDVADPTHPKLLGSAPVYGSASAVAVGGGHIYVAEGLGGGVEIFDMSDPISPTLRGGLITPGSAQGIAISGTRAYLAGGVCGLQVLDVTDPTHPRLVGAVATGGDAKAIQVVGTRAYLAAGSAGLVIFDLRGTLPRQIAARSFGQIAPISDVFLDSGIAHLAAGPSGSIAVDTRSPNLPDYGAVGSLGGVRAVALTSDTRAYVALGDGGIANIDTSNPNALAELGRTDDTPALEVASGPSVAGITPLYIAVGASGIGIARAADGQSELVNQISLPGSISAIQIDASVAYAAAGSAGVHLLSLSDPYSPTLQRTIDTPGAALDLASDAGLLYVADRDGMQIIEPAQGTLLGSYMAPVGAFVQGIAVANGRAYLADRGGLLVVDISDPRQPRLLGRASGFSAYGVALAEGRAYLAAGKDGIVAFDLTNPSQPVLLGAYDTPGSASDLALAGDQIYVADNNGGLLVLRSIEMPYRMGLPTVR